MTLRETAADFTQGTLGNSQCLILKFPHPFLLPLLLPLPFLPSLHPTDLHGLTHFPVPREGSSDFRGHEAVLSPAVSGRNDLS